MGRAPCCDKSKVKRGPWSPHEDEILRNYLHNHGTGGNWISLPLKAGLQRCGKSCRLRWLNYLRPNIKHGSFTLEEDNTIFNLYSSIGSRWSIIASQLPGRTDNDVKNHWNTKLKKKLIAAQDSYFPTIDQTPQASSISTTIFTPKIEADYNPGVPTDFQDPGFFLEMPPVFSVPNHTQIGSNAQVYSSITDSLVSADNDFCDFVMDFGPGFAYDQMMSSGIWSNNEDQTSFEEALINLPSTTSHAYPAVWQNVNNQSYGNY